MTTLGPPHGASSGTPHGTPALKEVAASLERRIVQLTALADAHAAAGRFADAREVRALILRLQDELDDLHAGRWGART